MTLPIIQVDAFTERPYAGNSAAVCMLPAERDASWMQLVAREMNLSETAFLVRLQDHFDLRWFTPSVEVDLCGHATLASAHVLWEEKYLDASEPARFQTKSGLLTARRDEGQIWLDFPALPEAPAETPDALARGLGVPARYVGRNAFDYLVELESEDAVRNLQPRMAVLAGAGGRGVIVTSRAHSPKYDFVSRFFAPASGIDEDPVTGSAHCCLGPYWASRLSRSELVGYQASARGGFVRVRCRGDRVDLGGHAVTVLRGNLEGVACT
ncbi:MAG: PhzF family phenazine biosynthesis protein [Acidobacteriota bacterium]